MRYPDCKYILSTLILLAASYVVSVGSVSFALDPFDININCKPVSEGGTFDIDNPDPRSLVCPVARIFNILLYSSGVVLTIMIIYGAIKLSLALGDPKGYEGARQTWTWAILGMGVILGSFTILAIINNLFGLGLALNPFQTLADALGRLFDAIQIH